MKHVARRLLEVWLVVATFASAAGVARAEDDEGPSPWHLALDAGYGRSRAGFLGLGSVTPEEAHVSQPPAERDHDTVRLSAALGVAGLALEGTATLSLGEQAYVAWAAGVRLETSWDGPLSVAFRFAYVERAGDAPGRGGRVGIGLSVRPFLALALYADASAEATTPTDALRESGTLFAYALSWTGGARVAFR